MAGYEIRLWLYAQRITGRAGLLAGAAETADDVHMILDEVLLQRGQRGLGFHRAVEAAAVGGEHNAIGTGRGIVGHAGAGGLGAPPLGSAGLGCGCGSISRLLIQLFLDSLFQRAAAAEAQRLDDGLERGAAYDGGAQADQIIVVKIELILQFGPVGVGHDADQVGLPAILVEGLIEPCGDFFGVLRHCRI